MFVYSRFFFYWLSDFRLYVNRIILSRVDCICCCCFIFKQFTYTYKLKKITKSLNLCVIYLYSNYHQLQKCINKHGFMFSSALYSGGKYIKGERKTNKSKSTNHFEKKPKIFIKVYMKIPKCLCIIMFMNLFRGVIWLYLSKYVIEHYISLNVVIENLHVIYTSMIRN